MTHPTPALTIDTTDFSLLLARFCVANEQLEEATGREVFEAVDNLSAARAALIAHINAALSAAHLAAPAATAEPKVPEGFALVPLDAPLAMAKAFRDADTNGDRFLDGYAAMLAAAPTTHHVSAPSAQEAMLDPVEGDLLPPVGSKVLIHLARQDEWVEHTVSGYYVWGALSHQVREGEKNAHRVFVRVKDAKGYDNARLLSEVRPVATSPTSTGAAMSASPATPEQDTK